MNIRRLLILLVIVGLFFLFKPVTAWAETQRIWAQREWILYVLVTTIGLYLLYGLYGLYVQRGALW